jgi:hypothetical protein
LVGLSSGRLDALVFVVGLLLGTAAFAASFGSVMRSILAIGTIIEGDTITDAYGVSEPIILAVLGIFLVLVFYVGSWYERRGIGAMTAQQTVSN